MRNAVPPIIPAALALMLLLGSLRSAEACTIPAVPSISIQYATTVNYTGDRIVGSIPYTVQFPPNFPANCPISLTIYTNPMGQFTLPNVQNGQASLAFSITSPFDWNGYEFYTFITGGPNLTWTSTIPVLLSANQTGKPPGTYQRLFTFRLNNVIRGGTLYEGNVQFSATVASTCTLPPPSSTVLDFSPAIVNGSIPAPLQRTLSFNNAGCNGPAKLTLAGHPMKVPGNADSIHYSASAALGNTPVLLDTRTSAVAFANAVTAPQSGQIPVTITTLPTSAKLAAGTYTSTLRVSLEPAQ
jgi:hypothetical protein